MLDPEALGKCETEQPKFHCTNTLEEKSTAPRVANITSLNYWQTTFTARETSVFVSRQFVEALLYDCLPCFQFHKETETTDTCFTQ